MTHGQPGLRVFVVGLGVVTPAGSGCDATLAALRDGSRHLSPLTLFDAPRGQAPVGQVQDLSGPEDLPRTHRLARMAAAEAMSGATEPPGAVVLGGTTGGMPQTEELLRAGIRDPQRYRYHATGSVADDIAGVYGCTGPAVTVSTACSSGAVALKIALEMLRAGRAQTVLAGGVDGLCRLTYHGFGMLQLLDPEGARPLDVSRGGMSVGEGAGLMLLQASTETPAGAMAELLGGGLSCDAYHPSAPHPEGVGALAAIRAALEDAGLNPEQVDYINLHGTGTRDNDACEAKAIRALFPAIAPPLSSTKGTFGHSLAAAGAVEAAIGVFALRHGILPANVGCTVPDPALGLDPIREPRAGAPQVVLSNSLGFGGNNAALLLGAPDRTAVVRDRGRVGPVALRVLSAACITGAGHTAETLAGLDDGQDCAGMLEEAQVIRDLPPRSLRRLKRLQRLTLALGSAVSTEAGDGVEPFGVYLGTGWGPLSETNAFLERLFKSGDQFSSPTDFVGSVHNAVAGQLALRFGATGPNVTVTAGDVSFEQAVLAASLLADERPFFLCGVDEAHHPLTALFDPSVGPDGVAADGGGMLLARLAPEDEPGTKLRLLVLERAGAGAEALVAALGGADRVRDRYGAIFVGIPCANVGEGCILRDGFVATTGFPGMVLPYREAIGEFATSTAAATALAVQVVERGFLPAVPIRGASVGLDGKGILLLNLGTNCSAMEVMP